MISRTQKYLKKNGGLIASLKAFLSAFSEYGLKNVLIRIFYPVRHKDYQYQIWIRNKEKKHNIREVLNEIKGFSKTPKISILVPVYNVEAKYLKECIDSVISQYYKNWELILVDDFSSYTYIRPLLEEYARNDMRIKSIFRTKNGHISAATNTGLEVASGEFIALLDNDDRIKPEALFEVVKIINENDEVDMIYTDEDKIDSEGKFRTGVFFKPDWSPDAFLGHMYLCHFGFYRTEIARKIGGFRLGYEGAQDYDFVLRFTEQTRKIYHVAKVLYHWRMIPTSTASGAGNKDYAYDASIRAKNDAIKRRGYNAVLELLPEIHATNIKFLPEEDDLVSIIIPTRNHHLDLEKCISSILEKSTWKRYEIIIVDNGSDDQDTLDLFEKYEREYPFITILKLDIPFNYSKLNNEAVKITKGNLLLFLNNDTMVITPDWLEVMIGQARQNYTGAVGAKLYYEDNTIQHAGVVMYDVGPGHAFQYFDRASIGYFGRLLVNYNYLAVTGAALMVEKTKFLSVGGFDAENLKIAYNDVDLCLKLYNAGYFNVVRNDVELYHLESKSRGYEDTSEKIERLSKERNYLDEKWGETLTGGDPFYNENMVGNHSDFTYKT
ncbi:MAG: glycosyltransferase family 2 protein [Culicoidibacterales bacterium]